MAVAAGVFSRLAATAADRSLEERVTIDTYVYTQCHIGYYPTSKEYKHMQSVKNTALSHEYTAKNTDISKSM